MISVSLDQLIYNIRNVLKQRSDDITITDRQLEFIILYYRAKLIKQEEDKKRTISSNLIQDFGTYAVQKVDRSEDNTKPTGTYLYRTTNPIPKLIELNQKDAITYIGGIDKQSSIDFISKARSKWNRYNKYGKNFSTAYYRNLGGDYYIYIESPKGIIKYVNIEGIAENPRNVSGFDPKLDNYPISAYMISAINELMLSKELTIFLQSIPDNINDASTELKNSNMYTK